MTVYEVTQKLRLGHLAALFAIIGLGGGFTNNGKILFTGIAGYLIITIIALTTWRKPE